MQCRQDAPSGLSESRSMCKMQTENSNLNESLFSPMTHREKQSKEIKCVLTSQNPLGFQLSFPKEMLEATCEQKKVLKRQKNTVDHLALEKRSEIFLSPPALRREQFASGACSANTTATEGRILAASAVSSSQQTLGNSSSAFEQQRIKRLEEQLEAHQREIRDLKTICGPVLSRLSLNCEQILELIQSELIIKQKTTQGSLIDQETSDFNLEQKLQQVIGHNQKQLGAYILRNSKQKLEQGSSGSLNDLTKRQSLGQQEFEQGP